MASVDKGLGLVLGLEDGAKIELAYEMRLSLAVLLPWIIKRLGLGG